MSTFPQICGIDVSKDTLDYCVLKSQSNIQLKKDHLYESLKNDLSVIHAEFSGSEFNETLFVLESTGNYSSKLLYQLSKMERPVCVVSPYQSSSYMSALGMTNKNDKQAAYALSMMGQQMTLRYYKAPSEEMQKRKQVLSTLRALEKQAQMLRNQLHALVQLPVIEQSAIDALETVLQTVEQQIKPLQEKLNAKTDDATFNLKKKYATSVKGIGPKTAEAILLVTNGLEDFSNPDKLAKFFGITPHSHESGSSIRKRGKITKYGSGEVRSLLYMCTRSAIRYNQPCKELYERLRRNGKPHKVAAVAVMHKLVKQVYACVMSESLFDNEYHLKKRT